MSDADFKAAWDNFWTEAQKYSNAQRSGLLILVKANLKASLIEAGQPAGAEKAADKPAPATPAAAPATAPAAPAAAAAPAASTAAPVTGNRVSTKVAAPPGGQSSISFGDDGKGAGPSTGRKLYAQSSASSISLGDDGGGAGNKTSVRVANAPGGGSSIQLGDDSTGRKVDDDGTGRPKKFTAGRKQLAPAGGHTHDIFSNDGKDVNQKSSVRNHQAPGGKSSISLGSDGGAAASPTNAGAAASAAAPAAGAEKSADAGGDELTPALMAEISAAVYRKGKVKDTFTKLTQNKGKGLSAADLKEGMGSQIGVAISDAQAAKLVAKFAKDPAGGITFNEFIKMLAV